MISERGKRLINRNIVRFELENKNLKNEIKNNKPVELPTKNSDNIWFDIRSKLNISNYNGYNESIDRTDTYTHDKIIVRKNPKKMYTVITNMCTINDNLLINCPYITRGKKYDEFFMALESALKRDVYVEIITTKSKKGG